MKNYDVQLEQLLKKYRLNSKKNQFEDIINKYIDYIIKQFKVEYGREPQIVIWGGGEHTKYLLELESVKKLDIRYIVDKSQKYLENKIKDIDVVSLERLKNIEFDIFLISSFQYRNEIKNDIMNLFPDKLYIDIYENNQKEYYAAFYVYDYYNLKYCFERYKKKGSEQTLRDLIIELFYIRDFISAKMYIEEYIDKRYAGFIEMFNFLNELDELISSFKQDVLNKNQENIIFLVVDSLTKKDIKNYMPCLNNFSKENIFFENAFAPSTYTGESHRAFFTGNNLFEKETFKCKVLNEDTSYFLKELKERKYELHSFDFLKMLDRKCLDFYGEETFMPVSKVLWNYFCNSIKWSNCKNFSYLRFMESHRPNLSGYINIVDKKIYGDNMLKLDGKLLSHYKNYIKAIRYIDMQFKFYYKFLKESDTLVVLADHGYGYPKYIKNPSVSFETIGDDRINVPLIIKNKNYRSVKTDKMFNIKDVGYLILSLIDKEGLFIPEKDYIIVERTPIYNKGLRDEYIAQGLKKQVQALRIVRTKIDKYIVYQDGTEEYFLLDNDIVNLINNPNYQDRINYFRNLEENFKFPSFK